MPRSRRDAARAAEAALRPVAGVEELQVVGAVHDRVLGLLGIATVARSVWLHPDVVHHIEQQREFGAGDAEFVLSYMTRTILRPQLVGREFRDPRRANLVHLVGAESRHLCVALKFVAAMEARSGQDEIWVSTAFPMGHASLTRLKKRSTLIEVDWGADD
jgi:hypothetical protein